LFGQCLARTGGAGESANHHLWAMASKLGDF
jgi:hypothetical protein